MQQSVNDPAHDAVDSGSARQPRQPAARRQVAAAIPGRRPSARGRRQPHRRGHRRRLLGRQDQGPRGARGRPQTPGHVHRVHRAHRAPPPGVRGRRQLDRRGARRLLQRRPRLHPHRQLDHRDRQRPRDSGGRAHERPIGGRSRPHGAARRRQVRQRQLQGVGRPARRRRVGRQRAVRGPRPRDLAQRPRLPAVVRARQAAWRRSSVTGTTQRRGTKVHFKPDAQIFETLEYSFDTLAQRLRELAFLNPGVRITIDDERDGKKHEFHYDGGIVSFVTHLNKNKTVVNDKPIYMRGEKDGIIAEIALQWNDGYTETVYSFANNINTHEGGTHLSGFRAALTRTVNVYATKNNLAKDLNEGISGDDIREGLTTIVSVKIPRPQFEGQTKTKLGNTEVKGIVEAIVNDKLGRVPRGEPADRETDRGEGHRCGPRPRSGAQGARSRAAQGRARQQRAARQTRRLPGTRSRPVRDLHRRRRVGRRVGQAGPRPEVPGDPAHQGQDPERRTRAVRSHDRQRRNPRDDRGARLRHRQRRLRRRETAVPPHHHHDRRGRGRVAHPHAAADVLLPADARTHRAAATCTSRSRRCTARNAGSPRPTSRTTATSRRS